MRLFNEFWGNFRNGVKQHKNILQLLFYIIEYIFHNKIEH